MNSSLKHNRYGFAAIIVGGAGLLYPLAVYWSLGRVPAMVLVALALTVAVGRLLLLRRSTAARALAPALVLVLITLSVLAFFDTSAATLAYPVLMNAAMAIGFGLSLLRPPSLVECFAALTEPSPSENARAYMRKVSAVWCMFLTLNTGVSAATALGGDLDLWAFYNGFLSYVLMGALFFVEWLVRRRVQQQEVRT
ncbi:MAG: hypothetical protein HYU59_14070 [Magnetospirillum gryphiswaldense]|nr:hypothetical protein [Magnetospirillum gryphiswaldense]